MSGVVKIVDMEKQLMMKINCDDLIEVDKIKRYIVIVKQIRKLQTAINKDGVMTTTINASQEFFKTNPALNELNKLTKTLIAHEKSIEFERLDVPVIPKKDEKDNGEPEVSDLHVEYPLKDHAKIVDNDYANVYFVYRSVGKMRLVCLLVDAR